MTFKELLGKYKNGSATPEEREQAERELEKFDALTEYMLEQDFPQEEQPKTEAAEGELKKIRRNIKQRNAVLVCLAAGVACCIIGVVCFFEPVISRVFWYDPTETYNHLDTEGYSTLKIDSHIAVFSELLMPEVRIEGTSVTKRRWGEYEFSVGWWDYSRGEQGSFSGSVVRDRVKMADDFYRYCAVNIFSRSTPQISNSPKPGGAVIDKGTARAALKGLPDFIRLETYVSLSKDWNMEELAAFQEKMEGSENGWLGWVGIRTNQPEKQSLPLMGFRAETSGWIMGDVDEEYPYYEISQHEDEPLPKVWSEHFKMLLRYMNENSFFYRELKLSTMDTEGALEYVEKNGVNTYGFVCYGTPQEILQVLEEPDVEGIHVSDNSISVPGL